MRWIEIINLRSASVPRESIEQKLPGSTAEVKLSESLMAIQVYRHATLDTDLSVHLLFESPGPETRPSALGQQLVALLREYGLVNHSIWVEKARS
ncbi:hypothetical protein ACFL4G_00720 [Thermodesulfobacteriota bacterium]